MGGRGELKNLKVRSSQGKTITRRNPEKGEKIRD